MIKRVYVDGQHGTTGLEIQKYIERHPHLTLVEMPYEQRHDPSVRKKMLNDCDIAILCLPDVGSREAVSMIENNQVVVIDTSTAYRTDDAWCYGLQELSAVQAEVLKTSKRIANPGCHATAAILLIKPLIEAGVLDSESVLKLYSITGYSGGGKSMINEFESGNTLPPRHYAMTLNHKHIPEMMKHLGLKRKPMFMPVVGAYKRGIVLSMPLEGEELKKKADREALLAIYQAYYKNCEFAKIGLNDTGVLNAETIDFGNRFEIDVHGNETQFLFTIKLDNLGKGASGAAIQTLNFMYGWPLKMGI
ncbi:N-acetyl-gamma-glutamyl-phosphate reductase [Fusibacter paucivorans]|uniref:N-acetyl-gamma-glutamyl-phosphate reductase n=1 Tax=Fusibacter paucivorans TaxID=76009 RepID=A0ABS5PMS2_9FIRM|nr:N-acetyl-gamma-glutamyl-phosphate reductase [Fusibacter paucivorans]MBS7526479.1 N-acetyl-gamma-glutamyl-phosphate reductase [Fusibacter paucivorans]